MIHLRAFVLVGAGGREGAPQEQVFISLEFVVMMCSECGGGDDAQVQVEQEKQNENPDLDLADLSTQQYVAVANGPCVLL